MASVVIELDDEVTLKDAEELMTALNEAMTKHSLKYINWMIREIVLKGDY